MLVIRPFRRRTKQLSIDTPYSGLQAYPWPGNIRVLQHRELRPGMATPPPF